MNKKEYLDRGFEIKEFQTRQERDIFDYRERLIRLATAIGLHFDIFNQYFDLKDENKKIAGIKNYITFLSAGKVELKISEELGFFVCELVFLNEDGSEVDLSKLEVPVGVKVQEIVGEKAFTLSDLHVIAKSNLSQQTALNELFTLLLRKYY